MGECDSVYTERNRLVAALTKLLPSIMIVDDEQEEGWQHVVYVYGNAGQMGWHIGDHDLALFSHMTPHTKEKSRIDWDGHTTEEKYKRLEQLERPTDDDLTTKLTHQEALAVHAAIRLAYNAEWARLQIMAAQSGVAIVPPSGLYTKLSTARDIMDRRRERAEEMGG